METVVSIVNDKFKIDRKVSCIIVLVFSIVLGALSSLGEGPLNNVRLLSGMTFLDFFDFITNSVIMPIVALLTCFFVGYVIKPQAIIDELEISASFKAKKLFVVMIKYIAPICILLILVSSLLSTFGIMTI